MPLPDWLVSKFCGGTLWINEGCGRAPATVGSAAPG